MNEAHWAFGAEMRNVLDITFCNNTFVNWFCNYTNKYDPIVILLSSIPVSKKKRLLCTAQQIKVRTINLTNIMYGVAENIIIPSRIWCIFYDLCKRHLTDVKDVITWFINAAFKRV